MIIMRMEIGAGMTGIDELIQNQGLVEQLLQQFVPDTQIGVNPIWKEDDTYVIEVFVADDTPIYDPERILLLQAKEVNASDYDYNLESKFKLI